jgi:hypothetical protein
MDRWTLGGMILSSVPTRYQDGIVRQAGVPDGSLSAPTAVGQVGRRRHSESGCAPTGSQISSPALRAFSPQHHEPNGPPIRDLCRWEWLDARHTLAGRRNRAADHPDVHWTTELVRGSAAQALVRRAESADLVVVGSRGRGGFTGLLLGSVGQSVLHHAQSPVAIVR